MGRRRTARRRARGGDRVPSLADVRTRLARAVVPLLLLAALVAYPVAATDRTSGLLGMVAAAAVLVLLLALLWRLGDLIQVALLLAGAEFVVLVYDGEPGVAGTAAFAAGCVLVAELAYAAIEVPVSGRGTDVRVRRAATPVLASLGAGALALFLLTATDVAVVDALVLLALGVAAAVLLLALIARLVTLQRQ